MNRLIQTKDAQGGTTRYAAYDAGHRLQNIRTGSPTGPIEASFSYDANGSLIQETGPRAKTLTWDPQNRPKAINSNTFTYDPSGYRIGKTDSRGVRTYLLEGEHLEAIYGNPVPSQPDATYFRGSLIDEVVNGYQRDSSGNWVNTTYHHDTLQSVLGQSGHEGTILATQRYGAFGHVLAASASSVQKLRTGAVYLRWRQSGVKGQQAYLQMDSATGLKLLRAQPPAVQRQYFRFHQILLELNLWHSLCLAELRRMERYADQLKAFQGLKSVMGE